MKVFDNTERGIVLESALSLSVGDSKVPFQESLLCMPGATFGNRLVHADLGPHSEGGFCLHAIAGYKQVDDCALVRVRISVAPRGRQSYKMLGFENLAEVMIWQSRLTQELVGNMELSHLLNRREVHALAVLQPRGSVSFLDAMRVQPERSLLRLIRKRGKRLTGERVTENRLYYDGSVVTLRKLHYHVLNPDTWSCRKEL
jgi:hypothetical protein